jgi:glycosyltransferase involved in cell wall biosynthesis
MGGKTKKCCIVIPAFREEKRIGAVVRECLEYCPDVVVVDDGSDDRTGQAAEAAGAHVVAQVQNQGKGEAIRRGIQYAAEHGFDLVITLDADGQHAPSDIPAFLAAHARTGARAIVGNRMGDTAAMPWIRRATNLFMSRLLSNAMRCHVPDTQCGYRLYEKSTFPLFERMKDTRGYAAESEILLRLTMEGVKIAAVTIQTIYGDETSKIHPLRDTFRFFRMLRRFKKMRRRLERGLA